MPIGGEILCVGDSLTHGARDDFGLHYPELLGQVLSERHGQTWVCFEYGVNGEKSADILRRFHSLVRGFPKASEVLLWMGTNDAKVSCVPIDVFRRNVESAVRTCKFYGKPLILGLLPGAKGFGAPDHVSNAMIEKYNEVLIDVVDQESNPLVWYCDLRGLKPEHFCDGIHLTHEGNQWVAEQWANLIERQRHYIPEATEAPGSRVRPSTPAAPKAGPTPPP